jgi:hypothetical protein
MKHRVELADLVPHGGTFIELGVAEGAFSSAVLSRRQDLVVYSIDRWSDHHDKFEYARAKARLTQFGNRARVIRNTFAKAREFFDAASADMIYIDGYAREGQENGRTVRDWWDVVKPGGVMAGHDYHPAFQATVDAVDEFAKANGRTVEIAGTQDAYPSWWITKPSTI